MNTNEDLITKFYTAFQQKDYATMQACYADNATFSDSIFIGLNATQVKAMWEMLCKSSAADFKLEFKNIKSDDDTATAQWTAWYTFSATSRKVVNRIKASFVIEDGKIVQHADHFSFYTWARQAFGLTAVLLG
ncbi:nuclear transport factor 2 family protein [Mucilaginibacter sp. HMF5004]|uniref:nuclear transport factor 2 family protein n=1 Tax=Mucilaginibacter rivuli TaxID=2857527 RepID=UPI001C5F1E9A|nr:nuclear transport factor 2 family protein [Mucilaginibacter rivuli]MBW4890292.1 nuclear transport factor 2 family protein [Mucilaginibacter rivuli]